MSNIKFPEVNLFVTTTMTGNSLGGAWIENFSLQTKIIKEIIRNYPVLFELKTLVERPDFRASMMNKNWAIINSCSINTPKSGIDSRSSLGMYLNFENDKPFYNYLLNAVHFYTGKADKLFLIGSTGLWNKALMTDIKLDNDDKKPLVDNIIKFDIFGGDFQTYGGFEMPGNTEFVTDEEKSYFLEEDSRYNPSQNIWNMAEAKRREVPELLPMNWTFYDPKEIDRLPDLVKVSVLRRCVRGTK